MDILSGFDGWRFLAGLGIFLFGMHYLELALKNLAGRSFKKFLRAHTDRPVKGILAGTAITALLQSSSVVSLMVLAFVGAGIIDLRNAIGIIFGSNLGTTFTGWVVATLGFKLDIESFAFPLIASGGLLFMFLTKREKLRETGRLLFGFGLLFLGLEYMKSSIEALASTFDLAIFANWSPYLFFPIGFLLTAVIQSSSASMVIALSALNAGLIPLESAAALVIGSDLGTTITVMLGALNGTQPKKRVALSHVLFNLITDLIALALLYPLLALLTKVLGVSDPLLTLVFFHSSFNLLGIILMLPFVKYFARFLETRFVESDNGAARHIETVPVDVPDTAIEALRKEMAFLIEQIFYLNVSALRISSGLFTFVGLKGWAGLRPASYAEGYSRVKQLEGEIVQYYLQLQNQKLEGDESVEINRCSRSLRHAMESVKEIKDVAHNIQDFESSSNDAKRGLYLLLKGLLNDFHLTLHQVFHSGDPALDFECLVDLLKKNQETYHRFLQEVYRQVGMKTLSEIEISSLLNVNREVHHANRALILAIKDLRLPEDKAEAFDAIPELR